MDFLLEQLSRYPFLRQFIPEDTIAKLYMQYRNKTGLPEGTVSDLGSFPQAPRTLDDMPRLGDPGRMYTLNRLPFMDYLSLKEQEKIPRKMYTLDHNIIDPDVQLRNVLDNKKRKYKT